MSKQTDPDSALDLAAGSLLILTMKKRYATATGIYDESDFGGPPPWAYDEVYDAKDVEAMRTALAACIEEMRYSATMGQPISCDRREFLMAAPFLANASGQPRRSKDFD